MGRADGRGGGRGDGRGGGPPATADLAITNTDPSSTAAQGGSTTYTITVTNNGPAAVSGATVTDTFPSVPITSDSWTASSTEGASGYSAGGSGNTDDSMDMPVGSTITYTVTAAVSSSVVGTYSDTATVSPPAGITDPNPSNNSASETETLTGGDGEADADSGGGDRLRLAPRSPSRTFSITTARIPCLARASATWCPLPTPATSAASPGRPPRPAARPATPPAGPAIDTVAMPPNSSITYTITVNTSASAQSGDEITDDWGFNVTGSIPPDVRSDTQYAQIT